MGEDETLYSVRRLSQQKRHDDLSIYLSDGCDCAGASGSGIYHAEIYEIWTQHLRDRRQRAVRRGFRCKHKEDKDHHLHDSSSALRTGRFPCRRKIRWFLR